MDNQTFIAMSPADRVKKVNKLLQDHDMKEISSLIGIPSSSFSKIMREGDYIYHKADKRYYPFVRSEEERGLKIDTEGNRELAFFNQHIDTLKKVIRQFEEHGSLLLDKCIYSKDADFVNKSIRMNNDIYKEFTSFSEEYYPHLKTQDLIAQALIDAMKKYKPDGER
ncbi:hypothetical protein [Oceanobacillus oncorhynchi]|uniref:hypothetical protein n=1 Tax=Oceanobacillus oncorhynchi TaxID=545501 RepID=UPI00186861AC|nr:hypothetical protein [Oceanobacillus oncorhynchi]